MSDPAFGHPTIGFDRERAADPAANAGIAERAGIVRGQDRAGDLDEIRAAVLLAVALAAGPAARATAAGDAAAGAAPGGRRGDYGDGRGDRLAVWRRPRGSTGVRSMRRRRCSSRGAGGPGLWWRRLGRRRREQPNIDQ